MVFNQGAPAGRRDAGQDHPRAASNLQTGDYAIEWTSQIVDGPFNNFTGVAADRRPPRRVRCRLGRLGHLLHLVPWRPRLPRRSLAPLRAGAPGHQ